MLCLNEGNSFPRWWLHEGLWAKWAKKKTNSLMLHKGTLAWKAACRYQKICEFFKKGNPGLQQFDARVINNGGRDSEILLGWSLLVVELDTWDLLFLIWDFDGLWLLVACNIITWDIMLWEMFWLLTGSIIFKTSEQWWEERIYPIKR